MGGGGTQVAAPDNAPMLAMIAQMKEQQAQAMKEASAAQRQTAITTQDAAAQNASQTAAQQMQQSMGRLNAYQQASDAAALDKNQQVAGTMGSSVTGGGLDLNALAGQKLANLGAAAPLLPGTAANVAGLNPTARNPAMPTTPASNQFNLPTATSLRFGGV